MAAVMNDIPYGVLFWGTNRFLRENLQRFQSVIARTRIPQRLSNVEPSISAAFWILLCRLRIRAPTYVPLPLFGDIHNGEIDSSVTVAG